MVRKHIVVGVRIRGAWVLGEFRIIYCALLYVLLCASITVYYYALLRPPVIVLLLECSTSWKNAIPWQT